MNKNCMEHSGLIEKLRRLDDIAKRLKTIENRQWFVIILLGVSLGEKIFSILK